MLEELERTARRVLGGAHPVTVDIAVSLRNALVKLRARLTQQILTQPPPSSPSGDV